VKRRAALKLPSLRHSGFPTPAGSYSHPIELAMNVSTVSATANAMTAIANHLMVPVSLCPALHGPLPAGPVPSAPDVPLAVVDVVILVLSLAAFAGDVGAPEDQGGLGHGHGCLRFFGLAVF
jgi:hypothetical protein